ncbi:pilus assembly protein TadG-related protein [Pseudooceanicola aestuarii]|uniref:pilus assembly protein TadG-related protein n=1 Tax=Pseudooceanicola aestuarii TaxID=2697319 RepID=UPI0013CF8BC9|nr:pilus assembly protein TadG-related protein [Pseudooceanicola aestuarii]
MTILLLILIPAIMLIGALGTDIALLNAQKAHAQGQADLAAHSAARHLSDPGRARSVARAVAAANDRYGADPLRDADIVLGNFAADTGFVAAPDQAAPGVVNAVQVAVRAPWQTLLLAPLVTGDDYRIERQAVASARRSVLSFTLRNTLLSVDTRDSALLGPVLDGIAGPGGLGLSLSAVGYEGLARSHIGLEGVLGSGVDLDAMTVADALALRLTAADVVAAEAGAGLIPAAAIPATLPAAPLLLGDLVQVAPDLLNLNAQEILGDIDVNALDLLVASIGLSGLGTGEAISLSAGLNLAPLADVDLSLGLVRDPVSFVVSPQQEEPLEARMSQVGVDLTANALGLLDVGLSLSAADAVATLVDLNCAASAPEDILATFEVLTAPASLGINVGLADAIGDTQALQPPAVLPTSALTRTVEVRLDQLGQPVPLPSLISLSGVSATLADLLRGVESDLEAEQDAQEAEQAALQAQRDQRCRQTLLGLGCLLDVVIRTLDGLLSTIGAILGELADALDIVTGLLADLVGLDMVAEQLLTLLGIDVARAELIVTGFDCGTPSSVTLVN